MIETITIDKNGLHDILHEYDEDNYEANPSSAKSFVNYIFRLYEQKQKETQ